MKDYENENRGVFITRGKHSSAVYIKHPIHAYRGNPFIEALPPIKTDDEAAEALARYPSYDAAERRMPAHLRLHLIQNAAQTFIPLPVHLDLNQRVSRMICAGYQHRNPVDVHHWKRIDQACDKLARSSLSLRNGAHAVPLGFTITGFPGVEKTRPSKRSFRYILR